MTRLMFESSRLFNLKTTSKLTPHKLTFWTILREHTERKSILNAESYML